MPGGLQLEHHLPGGVALHTFVGQGRARDVAAQLRQRPAVVSAAAHHSVQAETLHLGTQFWNERGITGHGALQNKQAWSGYVSPLHVVTKSNVEFEGGPKNTFDPENKYCDEYRKLWGVK